jgi:hypothetical protein
MNAPDWAELFLALNEKGNPPHRDQEIGSLSEAQFLARFDGAEGRHEARALLMRLIALRLPAWGPSRDGKSSGGGD